MKNDHDDEVVIIKKWVNDDDDDVQTSGNIYNGSANGKSLSIITLTLG